jgi:hypothetical protein
VISLPNDPVRCVGSEQLPPGVDPTGRPQVSIAWPLAAPLELGALPDAPGCAALHAKVVAAEWGLARLSIAAGYVAAELVTQAVAASRRLPGVPPVGLWPRSDSTRLLVAVWDACPLQPAMPGGLEWPFGAVAVERGWHAYQGGKVSWSVLSWCDSGAGAVAGEHWAVRA